MIITNGIALNLVDYGGDGPTLLLAPGLTANARAFDALAAALDGRVRLLAIDLRGRGLSDQPVVGYTFADHAADIVGLLDALGIERAHLGGHSFGGLLALYLAAHSPQRVARLALLDAAVGVANSGVYALIKPAIDRLGVVYPSWDAYLAHMRAAAVYDGWWDPAIETYYRADIRELADGTVTPRTHPATIAACVAASRAEDWAALAARVAAPTLVLRAPGGYGPPGTPAIVAESQLAATRAAIRDCRTIEVPGNHATMLYGAGAAACAAALVTFLHQSAQ